MFSSLYKQIKRIILFVETSFQVTFLLLLLLLFHFAVMNFSGHPIAPIIIFWSYSLFLRRYRNHRHQKYAQILNDHQPHWNPEEEKRITYKRICFKVENEKKKNIQNERKYFITYITSADVNVFGIFDFTNSKTDASSSGSLVPDSFLFWTFPSEKTTE